MMYLSEREGAPKFLNESNFGLPILELLIEIIFLLFFEIDEDKTHPAPLSNAL
mgnify:CR=1 FL=1